MQVEGSKELGTDHNPKVVERYMEEGEGLMGQI